MIRSLVFALTFLPLVASLRAEVTPGEILLSEMNCTACHAAAPEVAGRLASRPSPRLGEVKLTPQWLRAFLSAPQNMKPGTLMPDMLHALPAEGKAEAVEALTHWLVSQQGEGEAMPPGASAAKVDAGRALYHEIGCAQCHAPVELPHGKENDAAAKEDLAGLQTSSVPLAGPGIASKYTVGELAKFLVDPVKSRAGGRMPAMRLSTEEAESLAMYLLREQMPAGKVEALAGLQYEYYEKSLPELPEFDRLTPTATGIADVPSLAVAKRKGGFALRFRGTISVPKDGAYKFYTFSDDGSRLYIDGKQVVENGGIHPAQERNGEVTLKAGAHVFMVTYYDASGQKAFEVRWKGPGFEKEAIPAKAFSHEGQAMLPVGREAFVVDAEKAEKGAQYFTQFQCASCHAGMKLPPMTATATRAPVKALAEMRPRQPIGCLSAAPKPGAAKFELTARQRTVLLAAMQNQDVIAAPLSPEEQVKRTLLTMNCYACHQRGERGGAQGLRREYLTSVGEVDLGDEGRIPPHLQAVGAKLQSSWMKTVLNEGGVARPYMATRMPQFGAANVGHLPALFEKADTREGALPQPDGFAAGAADMAKHGRKLLGTGGLSCIACHNFAGNKSLGIPALDLAVSGQRLKWDWFRRYLLDPQSLRRGTRMPGFWPAGVAANKDVLHGDSEQQLSAIWLYLARKNFTDLPAGLIHGKMELTAEGEAIMYRNFIEGGGARAIGVGYPEKANLCFDANELRIAMIWQGPFIDAARHRSGRGTGFEKPLGTNVVKLPAGPAFAVLASENEPWPAKPAATASAPFRGYRLDEKQRPTFHYLAAGYEVDDYPVAVPSEVDATFRRTLTVRGAAPAVGQLYFRAAVGKITASGDTFLVDEKLRLRFPGAKPLVRGSGEKAELLVPISITNNEAKLVEEIVW